MRDAARLHLIRYFKSPGPVRPRTGYVRARAEGVASILTQLAPNNNSYATYRRLGRENEDYTVGRPTNEPPSH